MLISLPARAVALSTLLGHAAAWLYLNLIKRPARAMAKWWREERAIWTLLSLDDRTLSDIGLSRCEIVHAVKHGRERPVRAPTAATVQPANATACADTAANDNRPDARPDAAIQREAA